ncbi:MAG: hypothetical protein Q8K70_01455 [Bacteroidota bacterium]|nr:hypothetical protein [Bacteroidota bacterium]
MKYKNLLIVSAILIGYSACKKDDDHDHNHGNSDDKTSPTISINDPKKAEYEIGDTAFVNVLVTDNVELHEAKCWFVTRPQNDTLWLNKRHSHAKTIEFKTYYVIGNLPEEQKVDFEVVAEDEAGNKGYQKHSFEVHDH